MGRIVAFEVKGIIAGTTEEDVIFSVEIQDIVTVLTKF